MADKIKKTEEQWREELTPQQYAVARQGGTERPFSGKYWNTKAPGTYKCIGCGQELFTSNTKYDSGCGWPSFYEVVNTDAIEKRVDPSHGDMRTEVVCRKCDSHLGHVFSDGPAPTGMRYCMNSASLDFDSEEKP